MVKRLSPLICLYIEEAVTRRIDIAVVGIGNLATVKDPTEAERMVVTVIGIIELFDGQFDLAGPGAPGAEALEFEKACFALAPPAEREFDAIDARTA